MPVTQKTATMAITPAKDSYPSLKNHGRHGSVSDINATGRRCTKAVATNTPVPKCCEKKTILFEFPFLVAAR